MPNMVGRVGFAIRQACRSKPVSRTVNSDIIAELFPAYVYGTLYITASEMLYV